jgi:hypothetical protein
MPIAQTHLETIHASVRVATTVLDINVQISMSVQIKSTIVNMIVRTHQVLSPVNVKLTTALQMTGNHASMMAPTNA